MSLSHRFSDARRAFRNIGLLACVFAAAAAYAETTQPVPTKIVRPEHPVALKKAGVSGVVMVTCMLDEAGNVTDVVVAKTTDARFNDAALSAMRQWQFKPATKDGTPAKVKITIPIKFELS